MLRLGVAGVAVCICALAGCDADSADPVSGDESSAGAAGPGLLAEEEFIAEVSDAERTAGSVAMDVRIGGPDASEQMRLAGRMRHGPRPSDIAMDLSVSGAAFPDPLSVIVIEGAMYLQMGLATGDKYVKYDLDDPTSSMGDLLGSVQLDPTAQVRGFSGAIEGFEADGRQRLDRVDTTRYRVTVDTTKLLENLETTPDAVFGVGVEPPDQLTYEFWVGADRLPRRISFSISGVVTRMDLSAWGEPMDIRAPKPGQITHRDPFAQLPPLPRA